MIEWIHAANSLPRYKDMNHNFSETVLVKVGKDKVALAWYDFSEEHWMIIANPDHCGSRYMYTRDDILELTDMYTISWWAYIFDPL